MRCTCLADLGRAALDDAYGDPDAAAAYAPDAALINFYDERAKMGMHHGDPPVSRLEPLRDPSV